MAAGGVAPPLSTTLPSPLSRPSANPPREEPGGGGSSSRERWTGKAIVVGDSGVGKTSLVERFLTGSYYAGIPSTVGCDATRKSVLVDRAEVDLLLFDTAGQERYACLTAQYFRLGEVCLLCGDLSRPGDKVGRSLRFWEEKVLEQNPEAVFVLVGTKVDQCPGGCSEAQEVMSGMARERRWPIFLTSAKEGAAVSALFYLVAEKVLRLKVERRLATASKAGGVPKPTQEGTLALMGNAPTLLPRCC